MNISFQKLFFAIATFFAFFAILFLAKTVLIPLGFALLMAFMLYPIVKKLGKLGVNDILAVFLSIFGVILIIAGGIFIFQLKSLKFQLSFQTFKIKLFTLFQKSLYTSIIM